MDASGDLWRTKPAEGFHFFYLRPWISPTVESPPMEISASHLDKVLGSPVWVALHEQEMGKGISRAFFQPQPFGEPVKRQCL